jgi:hypothetical protein
LYFTVRRIQESSRRSRGFPGSDFIGTGKALVEQSLKGERLFPIVNGNGGVAVVDIGALTSDFAEYRVAFDNVQLKPLGGRKNCENDVVCPNDCLQSPGLIVGLANEITGLGSELPQLFELSHLNTPTQLTA